MELLILQIAQWRENDRLLCQSLCFRPDEIERLHHAKVILQTLQSPPSLLELARQIELNDFKLKRGFREVFGTTVFNVSSVSPARAGKTDGQLMRFKAVIYKN